MVLKLIWFEVDGTPLDKTTEKIDPDILPKTGPLYDGKDTLSKIRYQQAENVLPLGSSWLRFFTSQEPQYVATMVDINIGKGRVINGGSVGWFRSLLAEDPVIQKIFQNIIEELR